MSKERFKKDAIRRMFKRESNQIPRLELLSTDIEDLDKILFKSEASDLNWLKSVEILISHVFFAYVECSEFSSTTIFCC